MKPYLKLLGWLAVAMVTLGVTSTAHVKQADPTVCTNAMIHPPAGITPVTKPNISSQFHTHVEVVIVNKNETTYFSEDFDSTHNRGYVTQRETNVVLDMWYDYNTNEFIGFYPQAAENTPGRCFVKDLGKTDARYLFGYQQVNNRPHIFSAAGALHYGGLGVNEQYMGTTTVRGIKVDWWRSCQYLKNFDATMFVDWYFSAKSYWDSAVGVRVPIQAHVTGKAYNASGTPHNFEHYYNFFGFDPYIRHQSDFETPAGVQCPGRKLTKKFPLIPTDAFSTTVETVDQNNAKISSVKETYYYSQKLVKYEYRPQKDDRSIYGTGSDLVEVHDFRTGVAYVTDRNLGNCSYHAIEPLDFDVRVSGGLSVRISNAKEFFYFDTSNVSYEGIKSNRDISCDSWVGFRTDFPFNRPENTTWDWYFATKDTTELDGGKEVGQVPVQMRITYMQSQKYYQYNFYNFKKDKPDLLKFDISGCYLLGRRKFQFMIHTSNTTLAAISTNVGLFKFNVLQAVMKATQLSPIRIAHLQTFFTDSIIVSFELLDKAPILGDVKRAPGYKEVTLDFAGNTLAQMVQNGQFAVAIDPATFNNAPPLVAVPYITEVRYSKNQTVIEYHNGTLVQNEVDKQQGYGPGPMAAVGVTMPILGGGLGIVFAYFFFK